MLAVFAQVDVTRAEPLTSVSVGVERPSSGRQAIFRMAATTGEKNAAFCEAPSKNPYLSPLSRLPPLHEPPEGKGLPFAPSIHLRPVRGVLVPHGEPVGFIAKMDPSDKEDMLLDERWRIFVTFSQVNSQGELLRVVKRKTDFVESGRRVRLTFVTPARSAVYRVDILFERPNGTRVARYGKYFRAAPPEFGAHIALSSDQIVAGGTLRARFENFGTTRISTGYGYWIQRFTGTGWENDPTLQDERVVPKVLAILGPVATFDCLELSVPSEQTPGRYRLLKTVRPERFTRRVPVAQEFTVTQPQ